MTSETNKKISHGCTWMKRVNPWVKNMEGT